MRQVVRSDEGGSALSPMPYMTSLVLGGKTKNDTVTSLANGAFAGNSAMTNLIIHADENITVGTGIFAELAGAVEALRNSGDMLTLLYVAYKVKQKWVNSRRGGDCSIRANGV